MGIQAICCRCQFRWIVIRCMDARNFSFCTSVGETPTISSDLYTRRHIITLLDEDGPGSIRAGA